LDHLIQCYTKRTPESKRQTQQYRPRFADPRSVSGFRQYWKEMVYPIVARQSSGSKIWDIDGNEYVDVTMGFGTYLLGHSPKFITQAIQDQLQVGIEVGPQSPLAGKVAELMCELTGLERASFCNTGSEAVLAAVRLARTVTGRTRIATTSGFHGINDEVLVRASVVDGKRLPKPIAPGIPQHIVNEVLVLDYGTAESLDLLRKHSHELAAVLIEPVQSRHPELQPIEFLREVRRITTETETALIFDEVITGFRCHPGGTQAMFGIKADIATYGKIIGGGMPIGAVAGSAIYMDALDGGIWSYGDASFPEVGVTFFAGTYIRHPLAMAASWAILNYLKKSGPGLQLQLSEQTARFVAILNPWFEENQVPMRLTHFASLFYFAFRK
jgi:glutamate-1-semialdehyde aminotransferase